MNQKQLKQLRAENRFEESYKLTKDELHQKQDDIWAKRNHSWSIYYLIKKHVQAGQTAQAKHFLEEFDSLQMPDDEKLLHERMGYFFKILDEGYLQVKQLVAEGKYNEAFLLESHKKQPDSEQLSWIVYYLLKSFNKTGKPHTSETLKVLSRFMDGYIASKKLVSKLILQELIKTSTECWSSVPQSYFLEKAGLFEILEEDDFQKQEWEGKKIISLAERVHICYSKALLIEKADNGKILNYIEHIVEPILEKYPAMLYVAYFKAKLLLSTGDKESGIQAFLPFARKKAGEFWVWQVFAEAHEDDKDLYFSCLCKSMTCKTKPEFLSNIQERVIAYLIKEKQYEKAKAELGKLITLREKQGWGLRNIHRAYINSTWFESTTPKPICYQDHTSIAESLLGTKTSTSILVIIHYINREKKLFGFLISENKSGFAKYDREPMLYGIYKLEGTFREENYFQVRNQEKVTGVGHPLIKQVKGKFIRQGSNPFGFVLGNYVNPALVEIHQLNHNDVIEADSLLAPVKGKKEWAWKIVLLKKIVIDEE